MSGRNRGNNRPRPQDQAKVPYLDVRERFLASYDGSEDVEWLIEVGRYVQDRWLAEERTRTPGQPLDEDACKHLWDDCSEKELVNLRAEALVGLREYRRKTFREDLMQQIREAPIAAKVGAWLGRVMLEGFVGGIGLIVLGLLLVWIAPHAVKAIRSTMEDVLPSATSPYAPAASAPCPQGHSHLTDPARC